MFEHQKLVEPKWQQDGFEIDSLTVFCPNCTWGVTLNAAKNRSLKAVSSEHPAVSQDSRSATWCHNSPTNSIERRAVLRLLHFVQISADSLPTFFKRLHFSFTLLKQMSCGFTETLSGQAQSTIFS